VLHMLIFPAHHSPQGTRDGRPERLIAIHVILSNQSRHIHYM